MNQAPSARSMFEEFVATAEAGLHDAGSALAVEAGKALVQRYFEMWNSGDGSVADAVLGPTYLDHAHPEVIGPAALRSLVPRFHVKNPDAHMHIEIAAADATFVAVRNTISRTLHGQSSVAEGIALFRVQAGKLVEQWSWYPQPKLEGSPVAARSAIDTWLSFRA